MHGEVSMLEALYISKHVVSDINIIINTEGYAAWEDNVHTQTFVFDDNEGLNRHKCSV